MTIGIRFPSPAGLLRESVLHRYAQFCHLVRERLLIHYLNQPVNIRDLSSGGRGRKFKSSHPDQFFPFQINSLQYPLVGHCFLRDLFAVDLRGFSVLLFCSQSKDSGWPLWDEPASFGQLRSAEI
jgi:hypothetical protein